MTEQPAAAIKRIELMLAGVLRYIEDADNQGWTERERRVASMAATRLTNKALEAVRALKVDVP